MRHLDEGLLGKVVRYKSGKTKLLIGSSRFDIDLGMEPGLLQVIEMILILNRIYYSESIPK